MADTTPQGNADQTPALAADLSKLTKAELVEQLTAARARALDVEAAREISRWRFSPEGAALAVTALLDLHRTVGTGQGSTIRGRKPDGSAPRYLEAAKALGERLCDDVLGPVRAEPSAS